MLEYSDKPGYRTTRHRHPDSVMITLSAFRRRVSAGDRDVEVELPAGTVRWVGAQEHHGENIGGTDSHAIFVELKGPDPAGGGVIAGATWPQHQLIRVGPWTSSGDRLALADGGLDRLAARRWLVGEDMPG